MQNIWIDFLNIKISIHNSKKRNIYLHNNMRLSTLDIDSYMILLFDTIPKGLVLMDIVILNYIPKSFPYLIDVEL